MYLIILKIISQILLGSGMILAPMYLDNGDIFMHSLLKRHVDELLYVTVQTILFQITF